ncbi:ATP-binding protein [Nocardia sp. CDC159]|uniref:ATP-binding protein n=1 Tax=Nocardia pulmonis TaxID=2951408 RepID=A0A9X2E862_9NOCA|nr:MULTISPECIES: ATP-binding protein [Nocardia]MCM6775386.1 ATP-binding protein [Nocardia pulmonis]MCM6787880.1 ATP-binding protein [Nocardia sp. CDC159]
MDDSRQSADPLHIEFRAVSEELGRVRALLRPWLARVITDPHQAYDLLLAVSEACSNSIEHGHHGDGRAIRLHAVAEDRVRITVTDTGTWLAPSEDPGSDRGRGLALMRTLVPDTRVTPGADGTTVEFTTLLPAAPPPGPATR